MKVYIAGRITGDPHYRDKFAAVEERLCALPENAVINPAKLPAGLEYADYMSICHAMLNAADKAVFLSDYRESKGARLEMEYCLTVQKPYEVLPPMDPACVKGRKRRKVHGTR